MTHPSAVRAFTSAAANAFAHVHPPYQAANRGHELIVMSYPHAISQSEFDSFTLDLGEKVMKYSEGKRNA